jgi:hypothetical protein
MVRRGVKGEIKLMLSLEDYVTSKNLSLYLPLAADPLDHRSGCLVYREAPVISASASLLFGANDLKGKGYMGWWHNNTCFINYS